MNRFVGIDLHKRLLVACIVDEAGNTVETAEIKKVDRESLEAFCKKHLRSSDKIAIEVTTHVWAVVRILQKHVSEVVVSNPMATKAIAQAKVKTDKVDSRVLAHLLRLHFLPSVWAPSEELSRLREWTARRNRVVQQRTQVINRM